MDWHDTHLFWGGYGLKVVEKCGDGLVIELECQFQLSWGVNLQPLKGRGHHGQGSPKCFDYWTNRCIVFFYSEESSPLFNP